MPLGYLAIVVGFLADVVFFKVEFNAITVVGMLLTSAGLLSKLFLADSRAKGRSEQKSNKIKNQDGAEEEDDDHRTSREEQMEKI
jgi:hypothetical protein